MRRLAAAGCSTEAPPAAPDAVRPLRSETHAPGLHHAVAVRHHPVKGRRVALEDQVEPEPVALPEVERLQIGERHPLQPALGILAEDLAVPAFDAEDEAEPVFSVLAEARPA